MVVYIVVAKSISGDFHIKRVCEDRKDAADYVSLYGVADNPLYDSQYISFYIVEEEVVLAPRKSGWCDPIECEECRYQVEYLDPDKFDPNGCGVCGRPKAELIRLQQHYDAVHMGRSYG